MKAIVVSTINAPTEAIRLFDAMTDWHLIVVGDYKTPTYKLQRGTYFSQSDQESFDKPLSDALGWNVFQRINMGFLLAYEMGAEVMALVNDDNTPSDFWGEDLMLGKQTEANHYDTDLPVFDPIGATEYKHLWHRGFPLPLLSKRDYSRVSKKWMTPQVQADFWSGDPDVDAICRMEHAPRCDFNANSFPMTSNVLSPFDCQNTFMLREVIKDYFLYPGIGRMDDIWGGFYTQAKGHRVVYGKPSVFHDRGPRDLIKDMRDEYLGYELNLKLVRDIATTPERIYRYLPLGSIELFELYKRHF